MDSRSARIQTEELLKITHETVKQGKTITVFTIVTIVFPPTSFMAAFFAINTAEFPRDADGNLGLGFVSQITFPVSAAITVVLTYVAFKVESIEEGWQQATNALGALIGAFPRLWKGPRTPKKVLEERANRTEQATGFVRRIAGIGRKRVGHGAGGGAETA
ncbi:hypothetical protein N658DRAFT_257372 [Parathielavia hyrcaniae]|uniref:Uncharacterized protein n=1 Tax=Parathielavia hyrcaniae TaxID=113614 RepID=A0AAN6PTU7_9PEZI|nr:hypothetical protein N658DRAFT_257372 [Parathielavia hyrcaniae]